MNQAQTAGTRPVTRQSTATRPNTRRRGAELEREILQAAWEQLVTDGYSRFTIDTVAERAHTSKHVLYRRWADREALLRAAIRNRSTERVPFSVNTGDLRLDMLAALHHSNTPQNDMAVLLGALLGSLWGELDMSPAELRSELLGDRASVTQLALERAVERGEIDPARVTPRLVRLPFDLFRLEWLMSLGPLSDAAIEEIIDELWLPLVKR